jgi:hypothetical protein
MSEVVFVPTAGDGNIDRPPIAEEHPDLLAVDAPRLQFQVHPSTADINV